MPIHVDSVPLRGIRPVASIALAAMLATASVVLSAGRVAATHTDTHSAWSAGADAALAEWTWVDESGCVTTQVQVQGVRLVENAQGPALLRLVAAAVFVDRFDSCLQNALVGGNASREDLGPAEFTVRQDLSAARLQTTIPMLDQVTNTTRDVVINVTWSATGSLTILEQAPFHDVFEGVMVNVHELTIGRGEATATGSVTIDGVEYVSGSSVPNELTRTTDTSVTVPRP